MSIKFKKTLLAAVCILLLHGISYGQWTNLTIWGASSSTNGSTVRYTATDIGGYYLWTVTGGVFENGQTSIVKSGTWRYEAYVTWNCSSTTHSVSAVAFTSWPPGTPLGSGSKSVSVYCYTPPVYDCEDYQNQIDGIYQYAPAAYKCSSIMSVVSQAQSQGLNCNFNTYGCY